MCNHTLSNLPNDSWRTVFGYLMVAVSFISTFENSIVFIILFSNKVLHTPTNKILAALAASDLFTGIILAPLHAAQLLDNHILRLCIIENVRRYLSAILIGASALTLAIISYDRYLHLVHLQNYRMTKQKLHLLIGVSWLIPCLVPLLRFIGDGERVYSLTVSAFGVLVFLIIVISYANLLVALRRHRKHSDNKMYRSYMENQHRAGRTVLIIITFYILMFLPTIISFILYATEECSVKVHAEFYIVGLFLSLANSAVNPIIYTYRMPELKKFKQQLLRINRAENCTVHESCLSDISVMETIHKSNERLAVIWNNIVHHHHNNNNNDVIGIAYREAVVA